jgi:hypothetical protein
MPRTQTNILTAAQIAIAAQDEQLESVRARQMLIVAPQTASGSADIDNVFSVDQKFRLVYVRCHFSGTMQTAALRLSLDSANGAAYDCDLYTITKAGPGRDVNLRLPAEESVEPSAWTFQSGDALRVQWTNPDSGNITWGVEVGLAVAS